MAAKSKANIEGWKWVVAIAIAYALAAAGSFLLTARSDGIAFVWPASGIALAGLLLLPPRDGTRLIILLALASAGVNIWFGSSPLTAVGYTLANLAECIVAAAIASSSAKNRAAFDQPRWVARFFIGAFAAALLSAIVATMTEGATITSGEFFASWFVTVFLGILIVTPVAVTIIRNITGSAQSVRPTSWPAKLLIYAIVIIFSVVTFWHNTLPLLFLPLAAVVLATFILGITGAVSSVFMVAVVGSIMTTLGDGPIQHVAGGVQLQAVFLQFYLVVLLASALPLASLLAQAQQSADNLHRSNQLLATAERTAHVGHWRYDIDTQEIYWSAEMYRIHGWDVARIPLSMTVASAPYHEDDMRTIQIATSRAIRHLRPFAFEARINRQDGQMRYVESHGEVEVAKNGTAVALFGVTVDVTAKVDAMNQLRIAMTEAERQAAEAIRLAETDQLTGIANRRKLMARLNTEIELANGRQEDLAFVMFDIDHFKRTNDTFGHAAGDEVLIKVAQAASGCMRQSDLVGRLGGEEFGAILPGTNAQTAAGIAERIRQSIEELDLGDSGPDIVTVSLGVASWARGDSEGMLMQAADIALYVAKNDGRNCYRLAA